jgi:hypothetical protein
MNQITMSDLIATLRKSAAQPDGHEEAQKGYFSAVQDNSVLTHSGTACCVAAYLFMVAHEGLSDQEINEIVRYTDPDLWVEKTLGLSDVESSLAFDSGTNHEIHSTLADILESGLRLEHLEGVAFSSGSTYTKFEWASIGDHEGHWLSLEELKDWMRSIARKDP